MTKTDLVNELAKSTNMSKKMAAHAVDALVGAIQGALAKGEKVQLVGFGTFEVRERAARQGRNPDAVLPGPDEERDAGTGGTAVAGPAYR